MSRPRSAQAHRRVLEATAELFSNHGIDATSMDAIAEASGVSKATIYKHWTDKETLCIEVLSYIHGLDEKPPIFDSGDFRADLIAQLRYQPAADRKEMKDRILPQLIAYSARNRKFGSAWRARAIEPARAAFTAIIKRGQRSGILAPDIDPETAISLLLGPIIYRKIFVHPLGGSAFKNLEITVADAFLRAFGTGVAKSQTP